MKNQNIGFGLFLIYLAITVLELMIVFGIGEVTDMATLVHVLELSSQIGLISKLVVLAMFGLLFTAERENE